MCYALLALVLAGGCQQDPIPPQVGPGDFDLLHYDGSNLTAPRLPGNTYEAGAMFPAAEVARFEGRDLIEIQFFILNAPKSCTVKLYKGTFQGEPNELIFSESVTNVLEANKWNYLELDTPIKLEAADLWICVEFSHDGTQATLGCDPGPAHENGDWLFDEADGNWASLRSRTGSQISINWNIRGRIAPQ